jgi:hypothetical protein
VSRPRFAFFTSGSRFFLRLFSFLFRVRSLRTPLRLNPAWVEGARVRMSLKPGFKLRSSAIGLGLCVFLALDFNGDEFLCAVFWVHNGQKLLAGDVLPGGPSIILVFHYSRDL